MFCNLMACCRKDKDNFIVLNIKFHMRGYIFQKHTQHNVHFGQIIAVYKMMFEWNKMLFDFLCYLYFANIWSFYLYFLHSYISHVRFAYFCMIFIPHEPINISQKNMIKKIVYFTSKSEIHVIQINTCNPWSFKKKYYSWVTTPERC